MLTCRYGGAGGTRLEFHDRGDLVVIRTMRRGARHDVSPLGPEAREANTALQPLFGVAAAGVGVWQAPEGHAEELAAKLDADPAIQFAGRGLRDAHGSPVVYTENVFVKFADDADPRACRETIASVGLSVKRDLGFARNAFFAEAPPRTGRRVFELADQLLDRDDVDVCHPELIRELSWNAAFPDQWHLQATEIGSVPVDAHASVVMAWEMTEGERIVIAVIDDGVDIDHEEFGFDGKVVFPRSLTRPHGDDPRPTEGSQHGTACAGVACADGLHGGSGVAPRAKLMPLRLVSGLGSIEEAEAFQWAADHGADVISCSWGPPDGDWWDPSDPQHGRIDPLPDSTRLAIDYATDTGRGGRGCVICWAAGNGNESVDNDGYASYARVFAVAACNDSSVRSAYSDMGDALWCAFPSSHGRESLTPGIWTTDRSGHEGYNPGDTTLGDAAGNYTNSFGGTSSACPGVAGVAALMLAVNGDLTWQALRDLLRDSCDRIDETEGDYDSNGHSPLYGYGRVNAAQAVALAAAPLSSSAA
jgi:subtilisin family serine protease